MTTCRLPFDDDSDWQLWNGNWDDPVAGHGGSQGYAFDFVHVSDPAKGGDEGQNIRVARGGVVVFAKSDRHCNTWVVPKGDPCYGKPGEGNAVLIRHPDSTVASYGHLKKDEVYVQEG